MAARTYREVFTDPQILALAGVVVAGAVMVLFFGQQIAPFGIAFVLAYWLDGGVFFLRRRGLSRPIAVPIVFTLFLAGYVAVVVGPLQRLIQRSIELASLLDPTSTDLVSLVEHVLQPVLVLIPQPQQSQLVEYVIVQITELVEASLRELVASIPQFTNWLIYLLLIPLLVFFFLMDKRKLIEGLTSILPRNRQLVVKIWDEMENKMGNYIRGKIWEILIVSVATWLALELLQYRNPVVLGLLSGISVVVPYVGAIAVAVPLFVVGYLQWGMTWDLGWAMIAYAAIQFVDGNVLVPLLFSEAVQLHPVVILFAVILFGSIWGVWGMFFAIPLATFVKSLVLTFLEFRHAEPENEAGN
jgi:putative permease